MKDIATDLYNVLKRYYPTISDKTIINYVNSDNKVDALSNLANIAKLTIKGAENSKRVYDSRQADISALYSKKGSLTKAVENGETVRKTSEYAGTNNTSSNVIASLMIFPIVFFLSILE